MQLEHQRWLSRAISTCCVALACLSVSRACFALCKTRPQDRTVTKRAHILRVTELTRKLVNTTMHGRENLKEVRRLVLAGADVNNNPDPYQMPPIYWACRRKEWRVVDYLLDHGATVHIYHDPNDGRIGEYVSPISCAAAHSLRLLKRMLRQGDRINRVYDSEFATPLMSAAAANNWPCVRYLVLHGAKLNAITSRRSTAMDEAYNQTPSGSRICRFLRGHGAKTGSELDQFDGVPRIKPGCREEWQQR